MDTWLESEGVGEDHKRRKMMETIEQMMARQASIAIQQSQGNMEELMAKCASTAVEAAHRKWSQEMEVTTKAIEDKMDIKLQQSEEKLMNMISNLAKANSAAGSVATTTSPSSRGTGIRPAFQPSRVELKGWVTDWDKRDEQMVMKAEAMETWSRICTFLPEEVRACIDDDMTLQLNNRMLLAKIVIAVKGGNKECWDLKKSISEVVMEQGIVMNRQNIKSQVELPPWKRPLVAQGGK